MIIALPLMTAAGLYVVELAKEVKIGRSTNMIQRVASYKQAGAMRAWISPPVSDIIGAEKLAIGMVAVHFGPVYAPMAWESFIGVPFEDIITVVGEAAAQFPVELVAR